MSLNIIDAKVRGGLYPSAEACDRDLFRLFEVAKLFIQPETPGSAYSDLMVLQVRVRIFHARMTGLC